MKNKIIERPCTCIIYVRVSSEEQVKNYSLGTQEKACREYAERQGWKVLEVFIEEGESAKTADRTQLHRMEQYCMKRPWQVGYIVVWKVDRFSRNQLDYLKLRQFFLAYGTDLKSATEAIEATPQGRFSESVLTAVAQYDNEIKMERTVMGMRARALDGYWIALAPWGYQNTKDDLGKKVIVPHPEKAPIVAFIFKEFARGTIGFRDLAKRVNKLCDLKSKHGLKISTQLVYKILRNPIYCGRVVVPKSNVDVKGKHEPIVSEELYNEVQDIMNGGKKSKKIKSRDNKHFPLRGTVCGVCRKSISGGFSTGKLKKKYAYYGCTNPECPNPSKRSIAKDAFEKDFTTFLLKITPDPPVLDALKEALAISFIKTEKDNLLHAKRVTDTLEKLEKDIEALLMMKVRGLIEDEPFLIQNGKMRTQKRELEVERASLSNPDTSIEAAVEFGLRVVRDFPTSWHELEPGELRVLRLLFFPENLEYHYPGFKTPKIAPIFNVESLKTDAENRLVTLWGIEPQFTP